MFVIVSCEKGRIVGGGGGGGGGWGGVRVWGVLPIHKSIEFVGSVSCESGKLLGLSSINIHKSIEFVGSVYCEVGNCLGYAVN
jgi:hypothetical protein